MKNKLVLTILALLVASSMLFAQVQVGARGTGFMSLGSSWAKETQEPIDDLINYLNGEGITTKSEESRSFGFGGALFANIGIGKIGIQPEIACNVNNTKGTIVTIDTGTEKYKYTMEAKYNSIDVPVLLTYDIMSAPLTLTVFAGPNFSFPFGKLKFSTTDEDDPSNDETVDSDINTNLIFGAVGGLAAGVKLGILSIFADIRYLADFGTVKSTANDVTAEYFTRRNLQASVGVKFGF